jgi:hypothetical protein
MIFQFFTCAQIFALRLAADLLALPLRISSAATWTITAWRAALHRLADTLEAAAIEDEEGRDDN